jgi:hypothetical protein
MHTRLIPLFARDGTFRTLPLRRSLQIFWTELYTTLLPLKFYHSVSYLGVFPPESRKCSLTFQMFPTRVAKQQAHIQRVHYISTRWRDITVRQVPPLTLRGSNHRRHLPSARDWFFFRQFKVTSVPPKCRLTFAGLHGVISQKIKSS